MDITKMLEADHRQVEALFEQIDKAEGDARRPLVQQLETALRGHMELEEQVLYPAMAPATGEEEVEEGNTEHELARASLAQMLELAPDDPGFGAAMAATKAGIEHHVEEEEGTVFPQLRDQGRVLEQIATDFMHKRMELGLPMEADALAAAASKDELVDEARRAGIEVGSSMTKAELASALAETMAGAS